MSDPLLRLATASDINGLKILIADSVRALSQGFYNPSQIESGLRYVFGPDSQLIKDETYYVIVSGESLVAAGGWSRRRALYGGDQMKEVKDPLLDPASEAARIRAFFVHPAFARRGLGRRLYERCARDAAAVGFRTLELMATLPGKLLYEAIGFREAEAVVAVLPDGVKLPMVRMTLSL